MLTKKIAGILDLHVDMTAQEIESMLEQPPQPEMGDVAFPCFLLAKSLKKSPAIIAAELAASIQESGITAVATGPYVNFFFQRSTAAEAIFAQLSQPGFGKLSIGEGKKVVIDMSSPNIAKPFGVGHLRSTVIGAALYRMYEIAGYSVENVNHLGDWGTQFGKQIAAYKRWGDDAKLAKEPIKESLNLYVKFHDEEEDDQTLSQEAREWFRKLEQGDEEATRLWNYFVKISMQEFDRMYKRLGVDFDHVLGESFYIDKTAGIVTKLQESGLLIESDEALVVPLEEEGMPPCLIIKQDGTTIYPTRDLATAFYRREVMGADEILYVVGAEQKLHFQQVFAVLRKLGESWAEDCIHVPFGLMKFEGRKMSTRRGKVVFLEEVLDEAVQRAHKIINLKNPNLPNAEEVAEQVGIGAIVFGDLKNHRLNEVDFSLEEALSFEGETGPYVQYAYARIQSLLTKAQEILPQGNARSYIALDKISISDAAWHLLKHLSRYPEYLEKAIRLKEPSVLARYVIDTAQLFNRLYHQERILDGEPQELEYKLYIAQVTGERIHQILTLLGVKTPERM
ncbi:arginine--tRNA ligase [Paenibacillus gallinarum]|uniref:Arginine--tRNA ligase n=1 Tax=Paenibacillus gallinarum TaxID=2762232 RepID=A0ABR8SVF4_9BACL|nr:arginine--tRNA ligase [Paenibacillus gallinarum]MBD7967309.1 arginine--tRNA ligase [Paenibacillus gallinarum]